MPCPLIGPFIFRNLACHYQLVDPGLVLCVGLIVPLQEFQVVTVILCRTAFHLSDKVVAFHLHNSTSKAYLCNQGGKCLLFFPG